MSLKKRILFLCTGNSCRSQMAEAWTRHLKGDQFEAYSAGVETREVDPRAIRVMEEVAIDISTQHSKHVDTLAEVEFDYVVTLCSHANEACPFFPARTKLRHVGFDDPPHLAAKASSEDEAMKFYRRVRNEIRDFVQGFPGSLEKS